jgi:DNA-binding LacI/PurR family transcriptional regulator
MTPVARMNLIFPSGSGELKGHMPTTMEDIARECGVTKKTVSRVFAGGAAVKASTRDKILAAAQRLNYEYNTLARNFSARRSMLIGVAAPFEQLLGSSYFAEAFQGFNSVVKDTGMDFGLFDTCSDLFNDGTKLAKLYRQRRVDGLLVLALHTYDRFLNTLEELHVPMVVVGERAEDESVCSVSCDDYKGMRLLCEHLYSLGHRKIAFVSGPEYVTTAEWRKKAFLDFCKAKELDVPLRYIQQGSYGMAKGREAGLTLLKMKQRPTAIIASNDMTAFGVLESARELNLRVPNDVSVAGFDDLPTAAEHFPSLTTVHQPVREMGKRSAELLLKSLEDETLPTGQTVMEVSLVVRQSTAAV